MTIDTETKFKIFQAQALLTRISEEMMQAQEIISALLPAQKPTESTQEMLDSFNKAVGWTPKGKPRNQKSSKSKPPGQSTPRYRRPSNQP